MLSVILGIIALAGLIGLYNTKEKLKEEKQNALKFELEKRYWKTKAENLQDPYFVGSLFNPLRNEKKTDYAFRSVGLTCENCGKDAGITRKKLNETLVERKMEQSRIKVKFSEIKPA